jgi:valyl-tRNA synthetase
LDKNKKPVSGQYKDLKNKYPFEKIENGLQTLSAPVEATYITEEPTYCPKCKGSHFLQETDTFDTWFSSGQWPLTALDYPDSEGFKYFYPTSVLDTMWDILFFWVARMIMFGLYLAGDIPFKVAHMHSRVVDVERKKMSKSRGNIIDPIEMVDKYGADALRMALIFGVSPASDIVLTEEKIRAMRNFANKVWNIGRFISMNLEKNKKKFTIKDKSPLIIATWPQQLELANWENGEKITKLEDKEIIEKLGKRIGTINKKLNTYRFDLAAEELYHFIWHDLADKYLENSKKRIDQKDDKVLLVLFHVYLNCLKLLHPFMPFLTENIWQKFII